jgi:hypothetical protein
MSLFDNYECEGQIELTDYLSSQIVKKQVKDLTNWINSQGKSQYQQIGEVVKKVCKDEEVVTDQLIGRITNAVSVYVLQQSSGYMNYLREQSKV